MGAAHLICAGSMMFFVNILSILAFSNFQAFGPVGHEAGCYFWFLGLDALLRDAGTSKMTILYELELWEHGNEWSLVFFIFHAFCNFIAQMYFVRVFSLWRMLTCYLICGSLSFESLWSAASTVIFELVLLFAICNFSVALSGLASPYTNLYTLSKVPVRSR